MSEELQLFVRWEEFLKWLLPVTDRFPKKARFTFTTRIQNLVLDILEEIIELRYYRKTRQKKLESLNIRLEKLRILLRVCNHLHFMSNRQFERAIKEINAIGGMTGSWLKGVKG